MKKKIAKQLNKFVKEIPLIFNEEPIVIQMYGWELNLSYYGEFRKFDKNTLYDVPFVQYRAVEHKQQLKDFVKRDGADGISKYIQSLQH